MQDIVSEKNKISFGNQNNNQKGLMGKKGTGLGSKSSLSMKFRTEAQINVNKNGGNNPKTSDIVSRKPKGLNFSEEVKDQKTLDRELRNIYAEQLSDFPPIATGGDDENPNIRTYFIF